MAEALIFHYREQRAFLNRCNPLAKVASVLILLIPLARAPYKLALILLLPLVVLSLTQRLPLRRYGKELTFFFFMAVIIAITEYLATRSPLGTLAACLRFLAIILCGMLLADSTAPDDLARSLGSVLSKIPFVDGWAIASSIELTISMVPLIFDVTNQVTTARKARMERNRHPIRNLTSLGESIFTLLLDRAEELAWALDARSFDPSRARRALPYSAPDFWLTIGTVSLVILTLPFVL
ncbi:energy-coupling factor transporter transmembrane component T [Sphaerochaeta sp. PS]|uniref:energy-coupling factor transporter transmembrane component T family protein n=1 Tax=Sphaerochaeta sp. PS TaxID=3076336 RepID=UPI0028A434DC|nr:energy-coupling factor transporter transmembrane component T [Sphaerochaeta sp. PS]MDT4761342.1 energy-coupling factor transporter transmembrane component T [Sphaerochaeta sp. PS]